MKRLDFNNEQDFLSALDGKVYAISNGDGSYLCDVLEADYTRMLDEGICVNLDDTDDLLTELVYVKDSYSQYILTKYLNQFEQFMFKEMFGVEIFINN